MNQSRLATRSANEEIAAMPKSIQGVAKAYLSGAISAKAWTQEMRSADVSAKDANLLKQFTGTAGTALGFSQMIKSGQGNQQTQAAALNALMGGQTGQQVALMLGGGHLETAKSNVDAVAEAAKHAGENIEGWSKIQQGFNFKLGQFKYSAEAAATSIGDALLPSATKVMGVLAGTGSFLADHPAVTKPLVAAGGILAASYAVQRVAKPVTTAIQGVGKVAEVLHIPGLDKLAGIGSNSGLGGAATSLTGAGGSLKGAAADLSGAAAELRGGALGSTAGKAGGAAAGAEGAAAGAAEGEAAAAGASRFKAPAMTAGVGALAALTIVDPMLRSMKSGPGGKNWFENPFGMPGIASEAHLGFLTNWNDAFGTTFVIMYGPTPGGGAFGRFFIGVPVGTRPEDGNARTLSNAPYGASRWIVILPVASSAVIPEIVLDLPAAYSLAPTIVPP